MKKLIIGFVFLSVITMPAQTFWQQTGFGSGGTVYSMTTKSNGYLFVGKADRMYRSANKGATWEEGPLLGYDILSMAKNDTNGYLYAGRGGQSYGGVYRSVDNGSTWQGVGRAGRIIMDIVVNSKGYVFAASSSAEVSKGGIYRSTDHGGTWQMVFNDVYDVMCLALDDQGALYAGTEDAGPSAGGRVFKSTDDGNSWNPISWFQGTSRVKGVVVDHNSNIYAAVDNKVFVSTNGGSAWRETILDLEYYTKAPMVVTENNTVYVGNINNGIYYSSDTGHTWQHRNEGFGRPDVYCLALDNDGFIYLGSSSSVFRSITSQNPPNKVVLVSPQNNAVISSPGFMRFDWDSLHSALFYSFHISTDSTFQQNLTKYDSVISSELSISTVVFSSNTRYYWRVRGNNQNGAGKWSSIWNFRTGTITFVPPVLLVPSNGSTNQPVNPMLIWSQSANAVSYQLQIDTLAQFLNPIINAENITDTTYLASTLRNNQRYYWRVRAKGQNNLLSGWSNPVFSFTTLTQSRNWYTFNTTNTRLPNNYILSIYRSSDNDFWIGTKSGLARLLNKNIINYNAGNSNLPSNLIQSVYVKDSANIWVGTDNGLAKLNAAVYSTSNSLLPINNVRKVYLDKKNNVWIGTQGGGLAKITANNWTIYNRQNSVLPSNTIQDIKEDQKNNIWVGTIDGLVRIDTNSTMTVYRSNNSGLSVNIVNALTVQDSLLYVGTLGGGLFIYNQITNQWQQFSTQNSQLPNNSVTSMDIDKQKTLWLGTGGGGLVSFSQGNWSVFATSPGGIPSNTVLSINCFGVSDVVGGTDNGLFSNISTFMITSGESYIHTENAKNYYLWQNYPNPFNPSTIIIYQIPKDGEVNLAIFDVLGNHIKDVVAGYRSSGIHSVVFDGSGLSGGVYVYRLKTQDAVLSNKLIIVK